jgi:phospholipase C
VSVLKFIERNWRLPTISAVSRDRLPNPIHDRDDHRYIPLNRPAIGDLMNLFMFAEHHDDGDHDGDDRGAGRDR